LKTCVIIAGGPSLVREDVSLAERSTWMIMGVNNAFKICEKLDYWYACDAAFWKRNKGGLGVQVKKYSLEQTPYTDVFCLTNSGVTGVSIDWPCLKTGGNSGYQAINLAVLLGFRKIVLLGYDMQRTYGKAHWHEDHKGNNPTDNSLKRWVDEYNNLAVILDGIGVEVLNASRETALKCFKKVSLGAVL